MRLIFANQSVLEAPFIATLLVWFVVEVLQAFRRRADATRDDGYSLLVLRICIGLCIVLASFARGATAAAIPSNPYVLGAVSLLLMWSGIGLRWWCFHTLGRYFTFAVMTSADQTVITSGPYRVLRHPSYTGFLLTLLGLGLTLGNWLSLAVIMVIALGALLNRIRVEEAALAKTLGSRYTDFARTRKRLIPYVW